MIYLQPSIEIGIGIGIGIEKEPLQVFVDCDTDTDPDTEGSNAIILEEEIYGNRCSLYGASIRTGS